MAYSVSINTSESQNSGSNQSTVYASLTLTATNQGYSGYSTSFSIVIDGVTVADRVGGPGALNTDGSGTETWTSNTYSRTFTHNSDGTRGTVATSGTFYGGGGFSPPSGGIGGTGTTFGALDYSRPAGMPSYCTASNVSNTITVNWDQAPAPFGPITYYWIYRSSSNGGVDWTPWSGETATSSLSTSGTYTAGQTYQFAVRAANSDGGGDWRYSNTIFLTAGGKRWTGSNWALTTTAAKRWTGSAWTNITTAKRFDGTNWVNLS